MEKAHVTIPQTVPLMLFGVHAQVSLSHSVYCVFLVWRSILVAIS